MLLSISQCPAYLRGISFRPPAVQYRKIDSAVGQHFHTARAAGLPWSSWRVDPDVHSLHQVLGQKHIVVAQEDHVRLHFGASNKLDPFLDHGLPGLVGRMGLAGQDQLYRPLGIAQEPQQPIRIMQKQVWSLIRGKTAGKPQCQCVRVKQMACLFDFLWTGACACQLQG